MNKIIKAVPLIFGIICWADFSAGAMPLHVPLACRQLEHRCQVANLKNGVKTIMNPFADCIDPLTNGKEIKDVEPFPAKLIKNCKTALNKKRDAINHVGPK